jgi:P2-related tail formation protein
MPTPSTYLDYLPALFRSEPFLGQFLLAFEQILSGRNEAMPDDPEGLEQYLDRIHTYFRPYVSPERAIGADSQVTPDEFLPWLANWVALSLRDDWDDRTKRRFISKIVPLYQKRGTKDGLKELLELYVNADRKETDLDNVEIYEFEHPVHYFQVSIRFTEPGEVGRKKAIAHAILAQEKPAHTFYSLQLIFPTMRIINHPPLGDYEGLILGRTTLLGANVLSDKK